jgi:hypothetical protein
VQLKTQDGVTTRIGRVTDTVSDLKGQVNKALGISEQRQRLFYRKAQGSEVELDEDWRSLTGCGVKRGDTLMLVVREPWQRTEMDNDDAQTTTVRLTLPEACVGVFEAVLDFMYRFHRDPLAEHTLPDLSAESALGALWLAGRLEMAELQEQVVEHLQEAVTEQSAPAYLAVAVRLGLVKVREAAMRLAAAGLGEAAATRGKRRRAPARRRREALLAGQAWGRGQRVAGWSDGGSGVRAGASHQAGGRAARLTAERCQLCGCSPRQHCSLQSIDVASGGANRRLRPRHQRKRVRQGQPPPAAAAGGRAGGSMSGC